MSNIRDRDHYVATGRENLAASPKCSKRITQVFEHVASENHVEPSLASDLRDRRWIVEIADHALGDIVQRRCRRWVDLDTDNLTASIDECPRHVASGGAELENKLVVFDEPQRATVSVITLLVDS